MRLIDVVKIAVGPKASKTLKKTHKLPGLKPVREKPCIKR